jgi:proline iminopeptidase
MILINVFAAVFMTALATPYSNLHSFESGCQSLSYQEYGVGKPIVLLAGGPGMNPAYMAPVARMLAAGGRRVILFHQRGTGASADAAECHDRMNLAGAIADIEALRKHLALHQLTLAGHSWGGMLAMAYAQEHPERIAGLVLLDTGPMDNSAFPSESAAVRARLSSAEQTALQQAKGIEQTDAIEEKAYFANPGNVVHLRQSLPSGEPMWYESVEQLIGRDLEKFDVVEGMRKLRAPVTLVFGRLDPGFFIAGQIQAITPESKLIVVEHAGHYPWLEDPQKTAAILKEIAATAP